MTGGARRPELAALRVGDPPELWAALGFAVVGRRIALGGVSIELEPTGTGILGWRLRAVPPVGSIDGLPTEVEPARPAGGDTAAAPCAENATPQPNGAVGVDHVVAVTPRFARTAAALADSGMELRRIRRAPGGFRQGFRRLGPAILELVERTEAPDGPARFWGLVVNVSDLDALAERLGDRLGQVRPAVQPGRRIATLREGAGLGEAVAFMSVDGR